MTWFPHFAKLLQSGAGPSKYDLIAIKEVVVNPFLDAPITRDETKNFIQALKTGKTPGIDGWPNELIKHLAPKLLEQLTRIYAGTWEHTQSWERGIILPLYKGKGDPTNPNSYRGISLLPVLSKVMGLHTGEKDQSLSRRE